MCRVRTQHVTMGGADHSAQWVQINRRLCPDSISKIFLNLRYTVSPALSGCVDLLATGTTHVSLSAPHISCRCSTVWSVYKLQLHMIKVVQSADYSCTAALPWKQQLAGPVRSLLTSYTLYEIQSNATTIVLSGVGVRR